jgi:hypothetical protein
MEEFDKWLEEDGAAWLQFVKDAVEDKEDVIFRAFVWCNYFHEAKKLNK